jgi:hypothetical protein
MSERIFQLHFVGVSSAELFQTKLCGGIDSTMRISVRGKTAGAFTHAGSFHFSSAVRALCVLCLKSVILFKSNSDELPILMGDKGSLAASLDYAITKQPIWIQEMFGSDTAGHSLAQRLFNRTNSHRKRPGPVVIKVNERALPISNIHIFWNDNRVDEISGLQGLLSLLETSEDSDEPEARLMNYARKLAA